MTGKGLDLEAQYNNRAAVPDHPAVMARWRTDAEAARSAHPPRTVAYGTGTREVMDVFDAGEGAPVVVFIHGGYWQALDRSWFSWVASALVAQGVGVAIPSYDLCPDAQLGQIVDQMRVAVDRTAQEAGQRPVVVGHSAGGHLAACLLSEGLARAAVAISGVFDLAPLISTSLNAALRLDQAEAEALSPIHWPVPAGAVLDCVVGGAETQAFRDQSRVMADLWGAGGAETRFEALDDLNHFTVLDALADADSRLVRRIVELALRG